MSTPDELFYDLAAQTDDDETSVWPTLVACLNRSSVSLTPFGRRQHDPSGYAENWMASVPEAIRNLSETLAERKRTEFRIHVLEIVVTKLKQDILNLESQRSVIVTINTFSPERYRVRAPIHVCLQPCGDGFEAGWFDASIHAAGDTQDEAVQNLKSEILDFFESLHDEPINKLGAVAKRQLEVLVEYIEKIP